MEHGQGAKIERERTYPNIVSGQECVLSLWCVQQYLFISLEDRKIVCLKEEGT